MSEYEAEIKEAEAKIESKRRDINEVDKRLTDQLDALKRRFLPRVKENKERLVKCNYDISQCKISSDKATIELGNWQRKAEEDQKNRLEEVNRLTDAVTVERTTAENELILIQDQIEKKIKAKQKEREAKTEAKQKLLEEEQRQIEHVIVNRKKEADSAVEVLRANQRKNWKIKVPIPERLLPFKHG